MNLSQEKPVISKPNLHTTLRVLHNLWVDGRLDIFAIDKILKTDYDCSVQYLEPDFMYVESLDGLTKNSLGDGTKYRKV